MTFRIRFRQAKSSVETEAVIEANSPTEAVVKFRCTRGQCPVSPALEEVITSVCAADDTLDATSW